MVTIPTEFLAPWHLWWMLLLVAILALYIVLLGLGRAKSRRSGNEAFLRFLPREHLWKRHVAVAAAVLSLASLVLAYARPKGYVLVPRERATIILALDVSLSMKAEDVQPNRMLASGEGAKGFVDQMPDGFNVGLVSFAGTAKLVVPPTTDHTPVKNAIDQLKLATSTAIGAGIEQSLNAIENMPTDPNNPDDKPNGVIVLLSDGTSNVPPSSRDMARLAKEKGIPIYTIAYGTASGYILSENGQKNYVPVNHYELKQIADISGGEKLDAASADELQNAYKKIASSVGYEKKEKETTDQFIWIGLLCAVIASAGVISIAARWP
ncbi:MAG: VWA domain-containing protein [Propionibacteriaceae bacterium]